MGRKTWDSMGKQNLKNRFNIVVTRQTDLKSNDLEDTIFCNSIQDSLQIANKLDIIDNVWVIGGSNIYEQCLRHPKLDKIYLTKINYDFNCDTFIKLPIMNTIQKTILVNEKVKRNV